MVHKYHMKLDNSPFLNEVKIKMYQNYIEIIQWAVEIRTVNLSIVVGALAQYLLLPRKGHTDMVLKVFSYCKNHLD